MSEMTVVEFGDQLLRTRDLDPVYVAVAASELDEATMHRLLLAYWCFYHLGAAAFMAERPKQFWALMEEAALNKPGCRVTPNLAHAAMPWPRGAERRHFRGEQAIRPVAELRSKYRNATDAVLGMLGSTGAVKTGLPAKPTFAYVTAAVQAHRGFGPWIAFKIADMAERVLRVPVSFGDCELGIYKDPRQGAAVAFLQAKNQSIVRCEGSPDPGGAYSEHPWSYPITEEVLKATVAHYVALWRKKRAKAPPWNDRLVNVQEIETIFCKYKSHLRGHYPLGKDTREVGHGLEGWGDLAQELKRGLPS